MFDEFDAYGEVPIPGSSSLQLPAGDATVTFRTVLIGGSGNGLPVPPLKYRITGPGGVDAQLREDYGTTTTVNNDARVRIGFLHVPAEGTYDVEVDGNVSAYLNPMLTFGHGSNYGQLPWIFAGIFALATVELVIGRIWAARVGRGREAAPMPTGGEYAPPPIEAVPTFTPSDDGIRVQTLDTLARLRDSGGLTEDEYEAEKKRVLEGR